MTGDRVLAWTGGRLQGIDQEAATQQAVVTDSGDLLTMDGLSRLLQRRDPSTGQPWGMRSPGRPMRWPSAPMGERSRCSVPTRLRVYDVASRTRLGDAIPTGLQGGGVVISDDGLEVAVTTDQGPMRWYFHRHDWVEASPGGI